ncbi:hypothetical protein [Winogradskyella ursingii]
MKTGTTSQNERIDIQARSKGIYFLNIAYGNTIKFIID